jgi:hypothetical protein
VLLLLVSAFAFLCLPAFQPYCLPILFIRLPDQKRKKNKLERLKAGTLERKSSETLLCSVSAFAFPGLQAFKPSSLPAITL